jgi:hypothetical protein
VNLGESASHDLYMPLIPGLILPPLVRSTRSSGAHHQRLSSIVRMDSLGKRVCEPSSCMQHQVIWFTWTIVGMDSLGERVCESDAVPCADERLPHKSFSTSNT